MLSQISHHRSTVILSVLLMACGCSDSNTTVDQDVAKPANQKTNEVSYFFVIEADVVHPENINLMLHFDGPEGFDLKSKLESVDMERFLSLRLVDSGEETNGAEDAPTIFGQYKYKRNTIIFIPEFSLLPGETYIAKCDPSVVSSLAEFQLEPRTTRHTVPGKPAVPRPEITSIFPSTNVLPANHLKFYLNFSEPMQRGDIFQYFSLFDVTADEEVPRPFRHTELWSDDDKTLTLWFHPGRQKTGVNLNVEIGPVLVRDHEYRLIVSGDWSSDRGKKLGEDVAKEFRASSKDSTQPNPKKWQIQNPKVASRDPVSVQFDEPLDWALLHSGFTVEQIGDETITIAGSVKLADHEARWLFTPKKPWVAGKYQLVVRNIIEDFAGNNLDSPFEVDVGDGSADKTAPDEGSTYQEFNITPADSAESN